MPTETVKVQEVEHNRPHQVSESASRNFLMRSRAVSAVLIFLVLFFATTSLIPSRERVDFLIRKVSADCWCPRFERFLCSSAKPQILLFSSSVAFVPSQMSDIKNFAVIRPNSVIQLQKLSINYASPAFFLLALNAHGIKNVSAVHMGIPTANITDDLLLYKKALAYGKKPDVAILAVNLRDFVVPPNWPAIEKLDEPIKSALGDILPIPRELSTNRIFRTLFVYARPNLLTRFISDQRFYFAYKAYRWTRRVSVLKPIFGQSDILHNRMATEYESQNHYNAQTAGIVAGVKLDPQPLIKILDMRNKRFEDRQFEALRQAIALSQKEGIRLVLAQVPVYPGTYAPPALAKRYSDALDSAAHETGVFVVDLNERNDFSTGHFSDLLHLNGLGGERLFWRLADFLAVHKTQLFNR